MRYLRCNLFDQSHPNRVIELREDVLIIHPFPDKDGVGVWTHGRGRWHGISTHRQRGGFVIASQWQAMRMV